MAQRILIVDDKSDNVESLKLGFTRFPYEIETAIGGKKALEAIESEPPFDVVVTDLMMPEVDGMAVLRAALDKDSNTAVIVLTAFGSIESAVQALREGAFHYLTKPVGLEEMRREVKKALERGDLIKTNETLRRVVEERFGFDGIIGKSAILERVFDRARQIANTRATVLVEGESGTGKELISKAIHYNSDRAKRPFLPVHCAALTETLLESELFGHEKGSFTGAAGRKLGRFELADGGTLFLDEIGEIPLSVQVKLLRFLETKEFMRVGGVETVKVDARVIAATNRDLKKEVAEGRFREDLYYRLKVIQIAMPPLRERPEDIPLLVTHFLESLAKEHNRPRPEMDREVLEKMCAYAWPGNVRQLRNVIESMLLFSRDNKLEEKDLPPELSGEPAPGESLLLRSGMSLNDMEERMIRKTLTDTSENRTKAAKILGISRRTLQRKLKELGLDRRGADGLDDDDEGDEE
jgi:two-component system response regulator AtoC